MKRLMAFIFSSMILSALTSKANAEELWGCNAFTASGDGSKLSPFVLRGDGDTYFWRGEYSDKRIKKVAENRVTVTEDQLEALDNETIDPEIKKHFH